MSEAELSRAVQVVLRHGEHGLRAVLAQAAKVPGTGHLVAEGLGLEPVAAGIQQLSARLHAGYPCERCHPRDCPLCSAAASMLRSHWVHGHEAERRRRLGLPSVVELPEHLLAGQILPVLPAQTLPTPQCPRCGSPGLTFRAGACQDHVHCCGECCLA